MGQRLSYRYTKTVKSKLGYESKIKVYQASRCEGCPLRGSCHKAKTNRIVNRNSNLQKHRKIAKENLWSLRGIRLRKQRNFDVEAVLGHLKSNRGFKRFLLRSLPKVNIEFGLLAIAHNIKKWWAVLQFAKIIHLIPNPQPPNTNPPASALLNPNKTLFKLICYSRTSQTISLGFWYFLILNLKMKKAVSISLPNETASLFTNFIKKSKPCIKNSYSQS